MAAAAAATAGLATLGAMPAAAVSVNIGPDISFLPGDNPSGIEPLTVGTDQVIARFNDLDNVPIVITRPSVAATTPACGDPSVYSATINWGDGTTSDGTVSCDDSDNAQYAVKAAADNQHIYPDSGTYNISVTINDGGEDADTSSTTATATVDDARILSQNDITLSGTEGKAVNFTALFADLSTGSAETIDSGLSASITWGDGTTSAGSVTRTTNNECECNVQVTASHVYDATSAGGSYSGSVKLSDDGGSSASEKLTATIADAALAAGTAKTFTMNGGQASTATVASFTDAAGDQAAAADFTSTIKWGDSTSSAGTVSRTGSGAFNVSGTHTYATAGSQSLTITVTDEEGQTLTISATATVPALPTTGRGSAPSTSLPALLAILVMASGAFAVGAGIRKRLRV
jgi:hypothetical protein